MIKLVETALRFEYVVLLDDINAEYINNNTNIMENVVQVIRTDQPGPVTSNEQCLTTNVFRVRWTHRTCFAALLIENMTQRG